MEGIWTVAAVLAGFQAAALRWRINREITMEEECETTWLTLADGLVAVSFLVLVFGVFTGPIFGTVSIDLATRLFGLSLVIFSPSPFVLAGHYNLYREEKDRRTTPWSRRRRRRSVEDQDPEDVQRQHVTTQEKWGLGAPLIMLGIYGVWWGLS